MPSIQELFHLNGRRAVITGGAGFLGRQHARALLEAGAEVALWDFSEKLLPPALEELQKDFGAKVSGLSVDITNKSSLTMAVDSLHKGGQSLDILVNNASMTVAQAQGKYFEPFESYPVELWEMALRTNLTGIFLVTQSLAPLLLKSGNASIINIASDVGVISPDHRIYQPNAERAYEGVPFNSPLSYATSKAAIIHMTKFWATYWARAGVRVNAISPAGVENSQNPAFMRELVDRIPMGRMAKPHELKGAIVFLASDASSFVTGTNLMVDGGRTIW